MVPDLNYNKLDLYIPLTVQQTRDRNCGEASAI